MFPGQERAVVMNAAKRPMRAVYRNSRTSRNYIRGVMYIECSQKVSKQGLLFH
jgi:hypothetical protein